MRILYGPSVTVMGKIIYNRKFNDNEERGVNGQVKPLVASWLLKNMGFILVSVRNGVHIGFLIVTIITFFLVETVGGRHFFLLCPKFCSSSISTLDGVQF